jgi:type I restriction enzyme S subunit
MSFPRYPAYKDSDVAWLGQVPEQWKELRLRFAAMLNPSKQEARLIGEKETVSFLPMEAIGEDGSLSLEQEKEVGECLNGYTYFKEGDVCIAKITPCFENGKGAILRDLKGGIGFGTTELIVARPRTEIMTAQFLDYLFRSSTFRSLGEAAMYGAGGQKRVPDSFVRDFASFLPPIAEQSAIATFLDRETAKIDALIAEQQRLIELLQEKRQAVISHAVIKGLNPDAPMKDSGVEWLGEVPEHWTITRLGRISLSRCDGPFGSGLKSEHYVDSGVMMVRLQNIKSTGYDKTVSAFIDTSYYHESLGDHDVEAGDLLIAGLGDDNNLVGRACAAPSDLGPAMVKADCFRFRLASELASPEFIACSLNTSASFHGRTLSSGSTRSRIPLSVMATREVALPPLQEQIEILAETKSNLSHIDRLKSKAESAVSLLQERRSALISAAVTGQIDVRGVVAEASAA